jgi:hypothetical protein
MGIAMARPMQTSKKWCLPSFFLFNVKDSDVVVICGRGDQVRVDGLASGSTPATRQQIDLCYPDSKKSLISQMLLE